MTISGIPSKDNYYDNRRLILRPWDGAEVGSPLQLVRRGRQTIGWLNYWSPTRNLAGEWPNSWYGRESTIPPCGVKPTWASESEQPKTILRSFALRRRGRRCTVRFHGKQPPEARDWASVL